MMPTQREIMRFLMRFFLSVRVRMTKGRMMKSGANWMMAKAEVSQICAADAEPLAETSLQSVVTGTPTAPNPVATVLPMSDTKAENIGLNPNPMRMAAGIATAVPNPAIPSSNPPKPQTSISTSNPLSSVIEVNCFLITSICLLSTKML